MPAPPTNTAVSRAQAAARTAVGAQQLRSGSSTPAQGPRMRGPGGQGGSRLLKPFTESQSPRGDAQVRWLPGGRATGPGSRTGRERVDPPAEARPRPRAARETEARGGRGPAHGRLGPPRAPPAAREGRERAEGGPRDPPAPPGPASRGGLPPAAAPTRTLSCRPSPRPCHPASPRRYLARRSAAS